MVVLPALVLLLAQLVPDRIFSPAPLVHVLALWVQRLRHSLHKPPSLTKLSLAAVGSSRNSLLDSLVPAGQLVFPTTLASHVAPLPGWTWCSTLRLPRLLSSRGRRDCTAPWRCQRLHAFHRSRSSCTYCSRTCLPLGRQDCA
jgi:hypothetical protein